MLRLAGQLSPRQQSQVCGDYVEAPPHPPNPHGDRSPVVTQNHTSLLFLSSFCAAKCNQRWQLEKKNIHFNLLICNPNNCYENPEKHNFKCAKNVLIIIIKFLFFFVCFVFVYINISVYWSNSYFKSNGMPAVLEPPTDILSRKLPIHLSKSIMKVHQAAQLKMYLH